MATQHAKPGEIVDLKFWAGGLPNHRTKAIVKTEEMELIRIALPAGKEISEHKVDGPIMVHCTEGRIEFTAMNNSQEIKSSQLLYLSPGELHSLKALEDAVVLLTIIFK